MKQTPYNSFEELIDAMKANPGKIVCAAITGGAGLIWAEKIKDYYGVDFKVVQYDDGASMRTAMLGLHADFMLGSCAGDLNLGDDAQPLCVVGSERSAAACTGSGRCSCSSYFNTYNYQLCRRFRTILE